MNMQRLPSLRTHDPADFGQVAVLLGGESSEREVSLKSGAAVLAALQSRGVNAFAVDGIKALLPAIAEGRVDRVFNILHGGDGENGVVQGLLAALGIPCTGTGVLGAALTLDKIRTKQVWIAEGLPTPRYLRIAPGGDVRAAATTLGLPVFLKPSSEGSSVGVARVMNVADLEHACEVAAEYGGEMLMEQMVEGEEFSVPVLGDLALPSIHIVPEGQWYDYKAKYQSNTTRYITPGLQGEEEAALGQLVLQAFASAGCTGYGRVDVMRDKQRGWQLIEINTAPGMTATSLVPKAARAIGIEFDELCWRILEQTL
ncbi:D-alanine--D-alanine ligase [Lysobacteraceae bacterium NML75-0749]|nr:D-alanine--D-alanine ligase [Xanthomonadaceae bacterium NML75-0749]PJK02401.1 D-alanine--D-alanine ligase [Xanthomonadaceae bacterium NML71-0210]PJK06013.1 D-alanine--D-alanine ligase [Xanthomonadaceae bacterium NML91-0268]